MAREILPYRTPPEASVDLHGWMLSGINDAEPLPTYLEGWDPLTDVHIERRVQCDVDTLRSATGLHHPIPIVVAVSWINQQSYMTECLYREPLSRDQLIRVTLPSDKLGGSIQLITSISVGTTDQARPLGTARWAGSILSRDEHTLVLEGDGPMFPIASVDFASTRYQAAASFVLQTPDDLFLPVLGSVLLLVNTRDKELTAALASSKPDPREAALLSELETSIGIQLMGEAVSRRGELESEEWPDQSVGDLLTGYLRLAIEHKVTAAIATGDSAMVNAAFTGAARANGFGRRIS